MRHLVVLLALASSTWAIGPPAPPRFPAATDDGAWKLLPREEPPLPVWARTLVKSMPRTTAAMLSLDRLHRVENPLGAVLAGKLRWVAADAIGCDYARRYAEADLLRAGVKPAEVGQLAEGRTEASAEDRALSAWARKMTLAAHAVTDEEMAALRERLGDAKTVALVHTLAHANFQNRIFLALGCRVEAGGPFPSLDVKFDMKRMPAAPARPDWKAVATAKASPDPAFRPPWRPMTFEQAEAAMEAQKDRKPRIAPPENLDGVPARSRRVVWSAVSLGHQPKLTGAWFDTMAASSAERKTDPVFANHYFWVITRSNECFY